MICIRSLNTLSPFQLLAVDENSDQETVKKNYYKLTKEFHPDRYFESADPSLKDKLTAIFDALTKAYTIAQGYKQKRSRRKKRLRPSRKEKNILSTEWRHLRKAL